MILKAKILSQGKTKEPWLAKALGEYEKRMTDRVKIDWIIVDSDKELQNLCLQENLLIALDLKGELLSSEALSQKMGKLWVEGGSRLSFVIGGPTGLCFEILKHARWKWSLSPLTFTHQIVRLLLIEQIYRALEIQKGSGYHK